MQHVCFYSGLKYLFVLQTLRTYRSILRLIQPVFYCKLIQHVYMAGSHNIPVCIACPYRWHCRFIGHVCLYCGLMQQMSCIINFTTCLFVLCSSTTTCDFVIRVHESCLYYRLTQYICFYCLYIQRMCMYCALTLYTQQQQQQLQKFIESIFSWMCGFLLECG